MIATDHCAQCGLHRDLHVASLEEYLAHAFVERERCCFCGATDTVLEPIAHGTDWSCVDMRACSKREAELDAKLRAADRSGDGSANQDQAELAAPIADMLECGMDASEANAVPNPGGMVPEAAVPWHWGLLTGAFIELERSALSSAVTPSMAGLLHNLWNVYVRGRDRDRAVLFAIFDLLEGHNARMADPPP